MDAERSIDMSRALVAVSNRLPFSAIRDGHSITFERSSGGLVSALDPVLRANGGVWVGWSGLPREEILDAGGMTLPADPGVRYVDVPLTAYDIAAYYHGFSNRTLWPLLHYFIAQMDVDVAMWRAYDRVNEQFAATTADAVADREALVWVHDYQLMRTPHHLRRLLPHASLAFFLHVPFPAPDVFRVLPWSRDLLRGLLASDYVGVHTARYAAHLFDCAEQLLGCATDRAGGTIRFDGRIVGVGVQPVSIDVAEAEQLAAAAGRSPRKSDVKEILGVDRLDYTKGVLQRLRAVERLFERYPAYRSRVRFTQVLVPSREHVRDYRHLKREIDETVGRINGRFSEDGWTPIGYFARSLGRAELFAAYRAADVALVTPLRDGMNLVAKEYVMAHTDGDGVLVLSELAGVADDFQEAVTVTPFDADAVAAALHRALSMQPEERRARMLALRARVRAYDVHAWVSAFVSAADQAAARSRQHRESPVDDVQRRLAPWLAKRPTLSLLLDYDGTLTPIVERPEQAALSAAVRSAIEQARRAPNIDVTIVTGRTLDDIQRQVDMPGLTYIANHGFDVHGPGIDLRHQEAALFRDAVNEAARDLEELRVPGAHVEHKGATLSYHYRGVAAGEQRAARKRAEHVLRRLRLHVTRGNLVVEGRPPVEWDKGTAVQWVLTRRHGQDWTSRVRALYMGDDATDEDAFRSVLGLGRSIRVAPTAENAFTLADFTLPDPDAVLDLLRWLVSGAFAAVAR